MKSSTFIKSIVAFLLIFTAFHYVVWTKYTAPIFQDRTVTGGLSRLAYDTSLNPKSDHVYPPSQRIDLADYKGENFEVMVFGDSFARGGFSYGGTKYNFFQDHMNLPEGSKVLTLTNQELRYTKKLNKDFDINSMISFVNSGFMQKKGVKHFVIESVQRLAVQRFQKSANFDRPGDISYLAKSRRALKAKKNATKDEKTTSESGLVKFINNRNYNAAKYNIGYHFDDNAYDSSCYKVDLNKDLFSSELPRKLLFFVFDTANIKFEKRAKIEKVNANLNQLSDLLEKDGIKLYFMPIVDKYTLYEKYITNNPYPKGRLFTELDRMPNNYTFINTKKTLRKELAKGVMDIYHQGDTHWNPAAPRAVFENVKFE